MNKWKLLCFAFRLVCSFVAAIMVGYWIYKFQKNEDITTIEYKYIDESNELRIPEMTICLGMPFIKVKFREWGLDIHKYYLFLKGDKSIENDYKGVDFNNATIDVRDYIKQIKVMSRDDFSYKSNNCKTTHTCGSFKWNNNFNGFWNDRAFCRCYGLEIISKFTNDIKRVIVDFKPELVNLLLDLQSFREGGVFAIFNYPQQLLRNPEDVHLIWDTEAKVKSLTMFKITTTEVMIRRNRPGSPCFSLWNHFDKSVYERHIQEASCTTPYQEKKKPACNTSEEMVHSKYEMNELRNKYFPQPCLELSNVVSSMNIITDSNGTSPKLLVGYPDKIKVITQLKSVDAHMLIGNIGGYIGLFLGNVFEILRY